MSKSISQAWDEMSESDKDIVRSWYNSDYYKYGLKIYGLQIKNNLTKEDAASLLGMSKDEYVELSNGYPKYSIEEYKKYLRILSDHFNATHNHHN